MSVMSVEKDPESLTMTVWADLDATVERAWQLWADPRQFEQWWGAPGFPTTVIDHDLRSGGLISFFMTGSTGERHGGTWEVLAADPPRYLELRDADVDDDGRPNDGNAMTVMAVTIVERDGGAQSCRSEPTSTHCRAWSRNSWGSKRACELSSCESEQSSPGRLCDGSKQCAA